MVEALLVSLGAAALATGGAVGLVAHARRRLPRPVLVDEPAAPPALMPALLPRPKLPILPSLAMAEKPSVLRPTAALAQLSMAERSVFGVGRGAEFPPPYRLTDTVEVLRHLHEMGRAMFVSPAGHRYDRIGWRDTLLDRERSILRRRVRGTDVAPWRRVAELIHDVILPWLGSGIGWNWYQRDYPVTTIMLGQPSGLKRHDKAGELAALGMWLAGFFLGPATCTRRDPHSWFNVPGALGFPKRVHVPFALQRVLTPEGRFRELADAAFRCSELLEVPKGAESAVDAAIGGYGWPDWPLARRQARCAEAMVTSILLAHSMYISGPSPFAVRDLVVGWIAAAAAGAATAVAVLAPVIAPAVAAAWLAVGGALSALLSAAGAGTVVAIAGAAAAVAALQAAIGAAVAAGLKHAGYVFDDLVNGELVDLHLS
jgi:hypothetical protein